MVRRGPVTLGAGGSVGGRAARAPRPQTCQAGRDPAGTRAGSGAAQLQAAGGARTEVGPDRETGPPTSWSHTASPRAAPSPSGSSAGPGPPPPSPRAAPRDPGLTLGRAPARSRAARACPGTASSSCSWRRRTGREGADSSPGPRTAGVRLSAAERSRGDRVIRAPEAERAVRTKPRPPRAPGRKFRKRGFRPRRRGGGQRGRRGSRATPSGTIPAGPGNRAGHLLPACSRRFPGGPAWARQPRALPCPAEAPWPRRGCTAAGGAEPARAPPAWARAPPPSSQRSDPAPIAPRTFQ